MLSEALSGLESYSRGNTACLYMTYPVNYDSKRSRLTHLEIDVTSTYHMHKKFVSFKQ